MNQKKIRSLAIALGLVASLGTTVALERTASACGGCFVPPEDNTVVTDHRMILSVGNGESTLYDQIRYQGSPESFAWVLPIRGEATVGVSADVVFATLDSQTSVQVLQPPQNCPGPINCTRGFGASADSAGSSSSGGVGGVDVFRDSVRVAQLVTGDSVGEMAYLAPNPELRVHSADVLVSDPATTISFTPHTLGQLSMPTRHLFDGAFIRVLVRRLHAAHELLAHPRRIL